MLENKLQKPKSSTLFRIKRAARYIPISALALLSLAPAVTGCARTDLTRLGLSQVDTTTLFFQIEQAKKDFLAYTRNSSDETLQTAYSSVQSAYEFLSQRGLHTVKAPSITEVFDIYRLVTNIRKVNENNESSLDTLLALFDDESSRKNFIDTYGSSPVESGGYVRIKNGKLIISKEQQHDFIEEYLRYINEFKEGNYSNAKSFASLLDSLIEKYKSFLEERELNVVKKEIKKLEESIPYLEALHSFVENPDKTMELYKENEPLYQFLQNLGLEKAKLSLQWIKSQFALSTILLVHGVVSIRDLMEAGDVNTIVGGWHTHPYNSLVEYLGKSKPVPPNAQDLNHSIYFGHTFLFSFGKTQFEIYRLKYGKPVLLRVYEIPALKPVEIPVLTSELLELLLQITK